MASRPGFGSGHSGPGSFDSFQFHHPSELVGPMDMTCLHDRAGPYACDICAQSCRYWKSCITPLHWVSLEYLNGREKEALDLSYNLYYQLKGFVSCVVSFSYLRCMRKRSGGRS